MREAFPLLIEACQIALVLFAAPLLAGWVRALKCWTQGRTSPGVLQPYRNLIKLFSKDIVLAHNASWVFRFTPYLLFGSVLMAGAIIPIISVDLPLSATADIIALVALFAIGRFFIALAGMDVGTAFGGMGSSREMMIASLAEPAVLMTTFTVSLFGHTTSLSEMVRFIGQQNFFLSPSMVFAAIAFVLTLLAETGRVPVDNPVTHLELTMIHEGMILEYSGRYLALVEWAGMMKLFIFTSLGVALFVPWGIPQGDDLMDIPLAVLIMAGKLALVAAGIVLAETGLAKMRIFRVPEFLGTAFLIATLGMLSHFILEM
ncbi:MAG: NADH-quinone oxidoreductase subunit H [Nitrospinae bacterium]|nr:NADH-quinone oxidoreductase subunit H [Nitrospinota bacterium]